MYPGRAPGQGLNHNNNDIMENADNIKIKLNKNVKCCTLEERLDKA